MQSSGRLGSSFLSLPLAIFSCFFFYVCGPLFGSRLWFGNVLDCPCEMVEMLITNKNQKKGMTKLTSQPTTRDLVGTTQAQKISSTFFLFHMDRSSCRKDFLKKEKVFYASNT